MSERTMVEIASKTLSAAINPFGAELTHLRDAAGRELMTNADPAYWTGHAPLLFPIVGRLNGDRYRLDGAKYEMAKHGFARRSHFECTRHDADRAAFRLSDSAETRALWPFAFTLEADYRLAGATLFQTVSVTNSSAKPMPASFGFHPAFAWPLPYGAPRADHHITFEKAEPAMLSRITEDGLIGNAGRESPLDGRRLVLRDDLFTADALVWDRIESRSVRYGAGAGPSLDIAFPDTPMLGIWTRPGAAYVCIEPWHGIADPAGFDGDIWDKPGIMRLEPEERRSFRMDVTLHG